MTHWKDWTAFHHSLNQRYYLIVAVLLIPFTYFYLEAKNTIDPPLRFSFTGVTLGLLLSALPIWWAIRRTKKALQNVDKKSPLLARINRYRQIQVEDYLILSAGGFVASIGYWLFEHGFFVVVYVLILVLLSLRRPNDDKAIRDLQLDKKEKEIIQERLPFAENL